jgi:hypothetical protein
MPALPRPPDAPSNLRRALGTAGVTLSVLLAVGVAALFLILLGRPHGSLGPVRQLPPSPQTPVPRAGGRDDRLAVPRPSADSLVERAQRAGLLDHAPGRFDQRTVTPNRSTNGGRSIGRRWSTDLPTAGRHLQRHPIGHQKGSPPAAEDPPACSAPRPPSGPFPSSQIAITQKSRCTSSRERTDDERASE